MDTLDKSDQENKANAVLRGTLDKLYPGSTALALNPVCAPTPHQHQGKPCEHPGKRPLNKNWVNEARGRLEAGTGRDQYLTKLADHIAQGGNVALVLFDDVLGLDADSPEDFARLQDLAPGAAVQRSGRGGHLFVRLPLGVKITNRTKVEIQGVKIDIRGAGTQVVVAPSVHVSGTQYTWERALPEALGDLPLCPAPLLKELILVAGPTESPAPQPTGDGGVIPEGKRHSALVRFAVACARRGMTAGEIEQSLREINQERCQPPLAEQEIKEIADWAANKANTTGRPSPLYEVIAGRTVRWIRTRRGELVPAELADFAATIIKEEQYDDGLERTLHFHIACALPNGDRLPAATVSAERFESMSWIAPAWGHRAIVAAGSGVRDHLRCAIQHLSGEVAREIVYRHTGWREIDGRHLFLHSGGAIGAQGEVKGIAVSLPAPLTRVLLPPPPCGEHLNEAVKATLRLLAVAPDRIMMPLVGATYRAVLGGPDFSLHIVGRTGVFKTELAALSQSHFGAEFTARELPGSWSSTANAIEGAAFLMKDCILTVDDYAPAGTLYEIQRSNREAERVLRSMGNRAGRSRMRADGSLRPDRPPRACLLSTGEDVPGSQSVRARTVILAVGEGDVQVDALS